MRIIKFEKGDKVVIVRDGLLYCTYNSWAERNGATNWQSSDDINLEHIFIVVTSGEHTPKEYELPPSNEVACSNILVLIEDSIDGNQFIIGQEGVQLLTPKEYFKEEEFYL